MGCLTRKRSKTTSNMKTTTPEAAFLSQQQSPSGPKNLKQELLLQIPECTAHLMEAGEALELAKGDFSIFRILEDNISLATIVKIGDDLQWPLTKDEPVVKLDLLHYLFSLPMKDGDPLSYGVAFLEEYGSSLGLLDSFLCELSCFSGAEASSARNTRNVDWKEFAPNVEYYNNFLSKAIAGGTGQVVKGIFKCSNAYTNQVHKGGEMILSRAAEEKMVAWKQQSAAATKVLGQQRRASVRKLSKMTEKLSKTMLAGVGLATGSVITPMVKSQAGKAFLSMVPGEVVLASLDAVNKIIDAAEVAERQALSATSKAASRMISDRFGENAGEAAEDAFATAGHCACIAWNVFKIRRAINPATSVSTGVLKNAVRNRKRSARKE
ncbi:hypothetical protein SADUNF_Sadunf18G0069100 [Salix dunnii]|uniref:Senescence domain-containing protein n=1 Tax=Salix dunnii TaxID=1413687 RepID=A0A835J3V0_9ROSI|nr:hypothetical protein SADUNF_Sadunf18G0069100 [Salix dunnii]